MEEINIKKCFKCEEDLPLGKFCKKQKNCNKCLYKRKKELITLKNSQITNIKENISSENSHNTENSNNTENSHNALTVENSHINSNNVSNTFIFVKNPECPDFNGYEITTNLKNVPEDLREMHKACNLKDYDRFRDTKTNLTIRYNNLHRQAENYEEEEESDRFRIIEKLKEDFLNQTKDCENITARIIDLENAIVSFKNLYFDKSNKIKIRRKSSNANEELLTEMDSKIQLESDWLMKILSERLNNHQKTLAIYEEKIDRHNLLIFKNNSDLKTEIKAQNKAQDDQIKAQDDQIKALNNQNKAQDDQIKALEEKLNLILEHQKN